MSDTAENLGKHKSRKNKAVGMMRSAKRSYFNNVFNAKMNNPEKCGKQLILYLVLQILNKPTRCLIYR